MGRRVLLGLGLVGAAVLLACAISWLTSGGARYEEEAVTADSAVAKQAMAVLRRLAADPNALSELVSPDATVRARNALGAAAQRMNGATVEFKEAGWFGGYLLVTVTCRRTDGAAGEQRFFLKDEGGELRITGPAL